MSKKNLSEIKKIIRYTVEKLFENQHLTDQEPSIEQQVYDEIEMRMRPTDSRLAYDEIIDIANEYNVDAEEVARIMVNYISKRDQEEQENLLQTIKDIIQYDFNGEAPDFKTFYKRFLDYDESLPYGTERVGTVEKAYKSLTEDPNQLSLNLHEKKQ